jgi:hypothetical protein
MARHLMAMLLASLVFAGGCHEEETGGGDSATVTTSFSPEAANVEVGSEVRAGGRVVGHVTELSDDGGFGKAVMELDPEIYKDGALAAGIGRGGPPRDYLEITLPAPDDLADPTNWP